jgi:hypothetical protein
MEDAGLPGSRRRRVPTVADSSRRSFLVLTSAGAAAAGAAVVLPAGSADAAAPTGPAHPGPFVAHVRNTATGEIAVMVGDSEVVVHDKDLARRIASIAHSAR